MTRVQYLREKERAAEIKVLRTEMFKSGYYWNGYMSKEEAREVLDRRDADPLYKGFISKLMPLCLSHTVGPAETLRSWEVLHDIYPDKPRRGGVDPYIVYDGEANAELRFDEDERRMGTYHNANNPRHSTYPEGDWSTRIPGAHPLLPAINSKVVRKALEAANLTARALIAQQKQQVKLVRSLLTLIGSLLTLIRSLLTLIKKNRRRRTSTSSHLSAAASSPSRGTMPLRRRRGGIWWR
jgi:hypothetical protein